MFFYQTHVQLKTIVRNLTIRNYSCLSTYLKSLTKIGNTPHANTLLNQMTPLTSLHITRQTTEHIGRKLPLPSKQNMRTSRINNEHNRHRINPRIVDIRRHMLIQGPVLWPARSVLARQLWARVLQHIRVAAGGAEPIAVHPAKDGARLGNDARLERVLDRHHS